MCCCLFCHVGPFIHSFCPQSHQVWGERKNWHVLSVQPSHLLSTFCSSGQNFLNCFRDFSHIIVTDIISVYIVGSGFWCHRTLAYLYLRLMIKASVPTSKFGSRQYHLVYWVDSIHVAHTSHLAVPFGLRELWICVPSVLLYHQYSYTVMNL